MSALYGQATAIDDFETVFGFRSLFDQMNVRAFYGDAAYEEIRRHEHQQRQWAAIVRNRAPELIDDVAAQVRHG